MTINWSLFWTPEFLVGTLVVGLLLHVVGTYMVRSLDWLARVLPVSFRRAQEAESARIKQLTDAATSDHAIYAALVAEATRLRSLQYAKFFISFVCFSVVVLFLASVEAGKMGRILGVLLAMFLIAIGFFQYSGGLNNARHVQRLEKALREVQRNLKLPVMD